MQMLKKLTDTVKVGAIAPGVWAVVLIETACNTGFSISFTYLALYLYTTRYIPMTTVGAIMLTSGILSGIFQVIGGTVADRFGHRRMLIAYQVAGLVAFAILAVIIATGCALWTIILLVILVPIVGGMAIATTSAIIADISPSDRLTESYGLISIAGNIGWAIGPLAGGYLLNTGSYGWLFGAGAIVSSFALVGIPFLPRRTERANPERLSVNSLKLLMANSPLIIFGLISVLFFAVMAQWGSTLSVFSIERIGFSTEQYGWLMTISGLLIVVFQYPVSRRIEWLGTRKALFLGSFLYGVGFLSFSWVGTFLQATGSVIILVAGEMLFIPTALAVVGRLSRPADRGKNMGFFGLCSTLGISLGPLIGGFLLDTYPASPLALWGTVAIVSFLAAIGFALWRGYPGGPNSDTSLSSFPQPP